MIPDNLLVYNALSRDALLYTPRHCCNSSDIGSPPLRKVCTPPNAGAIAPLCGLLPPGEYPLT